MKPTYLLMAIALLFKASSVSSQTKLPNSKTNPNDKIDSLLAKYDFKNGPGLSLAVIKDGAVVYKNGLGTANLEYGVPITTSTVFQAASVSKQFTVFAVLLLEQEGKLSIDDDIRKYLPEMLDYGHPITLRNLANHTSGLRDNTYLADLIGTSENDRFSNDEAVHLIMRQKGLNFIPGDEFQYSNSGYILLAEIVKRVSGQTFAAFTKSRIFEPLKMENSQFIDDPETIVKNRAYSYHKFDDVYYKTILNHSFVGSTGLNTTVDDLALWAINFQKKTIGMIFNKMKEKSKLNNGEIIPYGLGLENQVYKGLDIVFHGGGIGSYGSRILMLPEHNLSIVYMCNSRYFHPFDIVYPIVDYYLAEKETLPPTPVINTSFLSDFTGDYEIFPGTGYVHTFSIENDTLFQQVKGDDTKVRLLQTSDNEFTYPHILHSKFVFENKGQKSKFVKWHITDFSYKGQRVELKEFNKEEIHREELTGMYYNAELNTSYTMVLKENDLFLTHSRNGESAVAAFQPDIFISNTGAIEILRNSENKVTGFNLIRQGIRKIKFDKIRYYEH